MEKKDGRARRGQEEVYSVPKGWALYDFNSECLDFKSSGKTSWVTGSQRASPEALRETGKSLAQLPSPCQTGLQQLVIALSHWQICCRKKCTQAHRYVYVELWVFFFNFFSPFIINSTIKACYQSLANLFNS